MILESECTTNIKMTELFVYLFIPLFIYNVGTHVSVTVTTVQIS